MLSGEVDVSDIVHHCPKAACRLPTQKRKRNDRRLLTDAPNLTNVRKVVEIGRSGLSTGSAASANKAAILDARTSYWKRPFIHGLDGAPPQGIAVTFSNASARPLLDQG